MPNNQAAQLIADSLGGIPSPDGEPIRLMQFTTALPEHMRTQANEMASKVGVAIVYLLESNGMQIVPTNHLAALQEQAGVRAENAPPVAQVKCSACDTTLLEVNVSKMDNVRVPGHVLIEGLGKRDPACPHGAL